MADWAPKRFWTAAGVTAVETGFAVQLDGRPVKTPAKAPLVVPNAALATAIAAEWDAQAKLVDPRTMPVTRAANSAIDTVVPNRATVLGMIAAYGGSDLLCYRAESPPPLIERQAAAWDPLLNWAASAHGAPLRVTAGIVHVAQPPESLARLNAHLDSFSDFELVALHDLVALSGSLVIGLAAAADLAPADDLWRTSRIDEEFQAELWGQDEEAAEVVALKRNDFLQARAFLDLARAPGS
ncbi:ATP12 family chaperone protein [Frigidibacter sp.]|uniref:ATP12 family chaperone protein n=1 Tax=Frigidibacter sp. TaxID=2586418 RepID=UPI002736784F|nr:ATP12 family protein [Frigidibacter sp.]MDP3338925.1 ATP12 family protein [Frigidibacter sp.]